MFMIDTLEICRNVNIHLVRKRKLCIFSLLIFSVNVVTFSAKAHDYFNPELLKIGNPDSKNADLSVFENNNAQLPGRYLVDIYLNRNFFVTKEIEFNLHHSSSEGAYLVPCITLDDLLAMGVKTELFPGIIKKGTECTFLSAIPNSEIEFQFNNQKILISLPQAAINQSARGFISPSQWENGINALLLNYSINGANIYSHKYPSNDKSNQYANIRPGVNLGDWRVRNYTTWSSSTGGSGGKWSTIYTYAQRNIVSMKGQLTLGESNSPNDIFDSVPFRGVQIASDDDMLPDSLKGYAPVVQGVAKTNAQVIIRQNGYIIYQRYVSPGAFQINDIYPTGGSGDLFVTIKESNGSEQHLIVPFASLPIMQRENSLKYSITSGAYRDYKGKVGNELFYQGTAIYGFPWNITIYGGAQFASSYRSIALGFGQNFGNFGALSVDAIQSWITQSNSPNHRGQSWRLRYNKNIAETRTNLAIAGYRYSTSGYYNLQDAFNYSSDKSYELKRNKAEITLNQALWGLSGSLSLSLVSEDYWNGRRTQSINSGYNNSWNGINYGITYSYNINFTRSPSKNYISYHDKEQVISFNISVPLQKWLGSTYINYNLNNTKNGMTTQNLGLNGTSLADNNLNWSLQTSRATNGQESTANLDADYRGTYGELNGGYSHSSYSSRLNYGIQGGVIAHANGITFGQPFGETLGLIQAKGADGVRVSNQTGVKTDWRGYTIVPYVSPYRKNMISLDSETLSDDADLTNTSKSVVPTRGAVVKLTYQAQIGARVLMTLSQSDGSLIPFGSIVTVQEAQVPQSFIVGDQGQVYLTGLNNNGSLHIQWGKENNSQCQVKYSLSGEYLTKGIQIAKARCL